MAKTCIVGGGRAGSGEHLFPACLGGLRINNGIYCGNHNQGYGGLAGLLAFQLALLNATLGIRNSRTKQIKPAVLTDPATGLEVNFDGKSLKPAGPRVLTQDGNSATVGFPDKKSMDAFVAKITAQGVAQISGGGQVQAYHPEALHTQMAFGGPEGLRAVGYVAQTFLAHCFPDLARNPAIKPFIDYTLNGVGDEFVWWDFEAPTSLPPNAFEFGHRIIVGSDGSHVYGRVSLFSTFNFAMIFYDLACSESKCVFNDIDPMAEKMPDDLKQKRETSALAPVIKPADTQASLRNAIQSGKGQRVNIDLMRRAEDYNCRIDAELLLKRLGSVTDLAAKKNLLNEFWETEPARVQRLLGAALSSVKSQNKYGDPNWVRCVAKLEESTKHDSTQISGLTATAEAATKRAADALVDAMAAAIQQDTLDQEAVELFIGGGKGITLLVKRLGYDTFAAFKSD